MAPPAIRKSLHPFAKDMPGTASPHDNPALAAKVAAQSNCLVIVGKVPDPPTLNYLRDAIGLLTFFLDAGGVAIYDPQILTWWPPSDWRRQIFDVGSPVPRHHVVILVSDDGGRTEWIHTRGMRKFGPSGPSASTRCRHSTKKLSSISANRFIEFLAFGGVIEDGQEIRMKSLPPGMKFFHRGNERIRISTTGTSRSRGPTQPNAR